MDYENIETDVLLTQVKEIAKVLKSRLEEGESEAKKNPLRRLMNVYQSWMWIT